MKAKKCGVWWIISRILLVIAGLFVALVAWVLAKASGLTYPGNNRRYSAAQSEPKADSPLRDKTILFLGSSVTHGVGFKGESFVEFLSAIDGVNAVKSAVSGTALTGTTSFSYLPRLKKMDTSIHPDAFICQLSTNDATLGRPLGEVLGENGGPYDTSTIAGAIEEVIHYVRETWGCPIIFYTNPRYDSPLYGDMVGLLSEIQRQWDIGVIDLWNDAAINAISDADYKLYMMNEIHPTKAGYKLLWLPMIQRYLYDYLESVYNVDTL